MDMAHERDASSEEEVMAGELRRGPWTVEEDLLLVNYVAAHGEGRWNSLARSAGGIYTYIHICSSDHHQLHDVDRSCIVVSSAQPQLVAASLMGSIL
jgi:hypothetical protein